MAIFRFFAVIGVLLLVGCASYSSGSLQYATQTTDGVPQYLQRDIVAIKKKIDRLVVLYARSHASAHDAAVAVVGECGPEIHKCLSDMEKFVASRVGNDPYGQMLVQKGMARRRAKAVPGWRVYAMDRIIKIRTGIHSHPSTQP